VQNHVITLCDFIFDSLLPVARQQFIEFENAMVWQPVENIGEPF